MTTDWGAITRTIVKRIKELDLQVQPGAQDADSDWQPQTQKGTVFVIFMGAPVIKFVARKGSGFASEFEGRWDIVHAFRSGSEEAEGVYGVLALEQRTRGKLLGFFPQNVQIGNSMCLGSNGPGGVEKANAGTAYLKVVTPYFLRQIIEAEGVIP